MLEEKDTITGKFKVTIYRQSESSFTVAKFILYELVEKEIIVTGYLPVLPLDILFKLVGKYTEHPKYGMQFQVESFQKVLPNDEDSILAYLSGANFPGIGKSYARIIIDTLGLNAIDRIKEDPSCLSLIPKMNEKRRICIENGLLNEEDLETAIQFFTIHGLGIRNIMRLEKVYGKDILKKVKENPYRLIEEVDGIGFITADKLAISMGIEVDDQRRIEAAIVSTVLEQCMSSGDSYILKEALFKILQKRFNCTENEFEALLFNLVQRRILVEEEERIYHHSQYDAEEFIAQFCSCFPFSGLQPYESSVFQTYLQEIQAEINIEYDEKQIEAIQTFFDQDALILTGGPGTGKTTVVKGMISLFKRLYPQHSIALCAPTGRAAKRLSQLTDTDATTIHSLLGWDLESNTFTRNEADPLAIDLLIIDEFSMVDNWLFYNLLNASGNVKKICIIGDEDQLPSVSCGCVLKDLVESQLFPLVRLEKIFRQSEGSDVITLAHQVRLGIQDDLDLKGDVAFFNCPLYDIKNLVMKVVDEAITKGYMPNDIQVLAPKYNGIAGIDALNIALQKLCNPSDSEKRELKVGYRLYREGDKILQLKNQPDDDVFNGDIGTLVEIIYANEDISKNNRLIVDFDGIFVEYTPDYFNNITHAYCISVHKSQGSEYPIVIMPIVKEYGFMLQRRLIYTGISRAKRSLVLLGDSDCFKKAIATTDHHVRKTTLKKRIERWIIE